MITIELYDYLNVEMTKYKRGDNHLILKSSGENVSILLFGEEKVRDLHSQLGQALEYYDRRDKAV